MSEILNYLYVGDAVLASKFKDLQQLGVTHIINMTIELPDKFSDKFEYLHINALDKEDYDLSQHFEQTNEFIHRAAQTQGKVYLHCICGVSRSPCIAMAYLIGKLKYGFTKAKHHVEKRREETYPNLGFMKQIENYANQQRNSQIPNQLRSVQQINTNKEEQKSEENNIPSQQIQIKQPIKEQTNYKAKTNSIMNSTNIQSQQVEAVYKCKACRKQLFDSNKITHQKKDPFKDKCSSIFIEQPEWITTEDLIDNQKRLDCPHCKTKLGEQVLSGKTCSCGSWIAPAFQILLKSIDICKTMGIQQQQQQKFQLPIQQPKK